MNPDTGMYEREEVLRAFADEQGISEREAARRALGGELVRVEATEEQIEAMSRAIRRGRERDMDNLSRLRRELEERERRRAC